ncbi:LOW QUALITY PROTEIN: hypothetical protein RTBOTA2_006297 [Rhodotorula toruloides]|nr:LOW QUALITY PROTEIN: hypothetical protein RTBOTA2_006297 [Rhodotorula toruloides]
MARRLTGLQRQVLSLYKRSLRMDTRPAWYRFVSHQFRDPELGGGLRRKDIAAIEHLLRRGEKMLDSYGSPGVKNVVLPLTGRSDGLRGQRGERSGTHEGLHNRREGSQRGQRRPSRESPPSYPHDAGFRLVWSGFGEACAGD